MSTPSRSFNEQIERAILQATHGRIGELRVESGDGQVVLRGRCASLTCKKLVQTAVTPLLGDYRLVNAIQIG